MSRCPACHEEYDADAGHRQCPACGAPLGEESLRDTTIEFAAPTGPEDNQTVEFAAGKTEADTADLVPPLDESETAEFVGPPTEADTADFDRGVGDARTDESATAEFLAVGDEGDTADFDAPPTGSETADFVAVPPGSETVDLVGAESATIDFAPPPQGATETASFDPSNTDEQNENDGGKTVDLKKTDPAVGDATVELTSKPATTEINADLTIQLSGDAIEDGPLSPGDAAAVDATWAGAAMTAQNTGQTLQSAPGSTIGQTVSGFRSTLPIKSRSLQSRSDHIVGDAADRTTAPAPDYELIDMLGQGGMGVVYAAKQSSIARTVAVKMLKPGGKGSTTQGSEDQRDKFISEAVITGELEHPNIVPIYDLGANAEGALFYSMKRVKGTPWDDVIKQQSLAENLGVLMRVADAVAFAHSSGVIHRDLKPENTMLGDYGEVLVMDWGLARVTQDFPSADSVHQADGLGGTPAYMAPEMARGPITAIDARSDIYLLGAILFEVVVGKPPHTGKDVMGCLMAAAQNKLRKIDPEVEATHADLLAIARRAMAKKPADRYQTVKEMQAALQEYLSHAESVALAASAESHLGEARDTGQYESFSRALYGFEEALTLWDGNERAAASLATARLEYARRAHDNGDFDLAASLIESQDDADEEAEALLAQIAAARAEREARQRRLQVLKRLALGLLLAVVGVTTFAYFAVSQQKAVAVRARDAAEAARAEEEKAKENAVRAAAEEEKAKNDAIEQRQIADEARSVAESAQQEEAKARKTAERARGEAIEAKQREEYEAYLARVGLAASKIEANAFDEARSLLDACPPSLRHWEWGRLRYLCGLAAQTFEHAAPVEAAASSPGGATFATGDQSGLLTIRSPGADPPREYALGAAVHGLAYSPGGRLLAAACGDGVVRLVDPTDGSVVRTLLGHESGVLDAAFSPDGTTLATCGFDQTVRLWNAATGEALQTLERHTWWVWSVAFAPDGQRLVSAGHDGRAIVWRRGEEGFRRETEFTGHRGPVYAAAVSPAGVVATAGFDRTVRVWNPDDVEPIDIERRLAGLTDEPVPHAVLRGHRGPVRAVAFGPDGGTLLSGAYDNTLRLWRRGPEGDWSRDRTLRGHGGRVYGVAIAAGGASAISVGDDNRACLWELGAPGETRVLRAVAIEGHNDALLSARFTPDGSKIVTGSRDRTARLWDSETGEPLATFDEGHAFLASDAVLFDDGVSLASAAGDNSVRVWDVATGAQRFAVPNTGREAAIAVSRAGGWLATGSLGNAAQVWSLVDGSRVAELIGHEGRVTALAAHPDGLTLATGDARGAIRLWRRQGTHWTQTASLTGHSGMITALAVTADGKRLVSASGDRTCGQWDLASKSEIRPLVLKHPEWVSDLSLSADGALALTAANDGVARLWRLADARLLAQTKTDEPIDNVDLSADGKSTLLTAAASGRIFQWLPESRESPVELLVDRRSAGSLWVTKHGPTADSVMLVGGNDVQLWRLDPTERLMRFSPHGAVAGAAVSPSGATLATASWDGAIKLWDTATSKPLRRLDNAAAGYLNDVRFLSDDLLVYAGDDGVVRIRSLGDGAGEQTLTGHRTPIYAIAASETLIATASGGGVAKLWRRDTGELLASFQAPSALLAVAISPNEQWIAAGCENSDAIIFDRRTAAPRHTLGAHTAGVTAVAFSPDGKRLLTGSRDGDAKIWDPERGTEVLTLAGHADEVTSVSFHPDGDAVLTGSRDGAAIVWPAAGWGAARAR